MKIIIEEKANAQEEDTIIIRCDAMNDTILKLIQQLKAQEEKITATQDQRIVMIRPKDVYYFEAVDSKVFLYTQSQVYEVKQRLYELEEIYKGYEFFRASKSIILNLSKIDHLSPVLGSRLEAVLLNKEKIIVSRQYVAKLKEILGL